MPFGGNLADDTRLLLGRKQEHTAMEQVARLERSLELVVEGGAAVTWIGVER